MNNSELYLELKDEEWPFEYTDHDRQVVRAICNRELPVLKRAKEL